MRGALQQISDMNGGKTILWAWMSRGYLEPELAAAWHFGGEGVCCSVAPLFLSPSGRWRNVVEGDMVK